MLNLKYKMNSISSLISCILDSALASRNNSPWKIIKILSRYISICENNNFENENRYYYPFVFLTIWSNIQPRWPLGYIWSGRAFVFLTLFLVWTSTKGWTVVCTIPWTWTISQVQHKINKIPQGFFMVYISTFQNGTNPTHSNEKILRFASWYVFMLTI